MAIKMKNTTNTNPRTNPLSAVKNRSLLPAAGLLGGQWQQADSGKMIAVTNPASGEVIAEVPNMTGAETKRAIDSAAEALPKWKAKTGKERAAALGKWHQLLLDNTTDLARIMTAEQGKPLAESRGETLYGASFVQWFAEEAKRCGGEIIPAVKPSTQIRITREAAGVCALITPWNFPIAMITRKAAPALAAGCTAIVKPAKLTPLSAIAVCALAQEAGIPAGVLNVLTGDASAIGGEMCANPLVRVLSFTGSTETGKLLAAACAPTVKKLALELGGNAPFIVFDDADLPTAVQQAMLCKFRNSGQTCVCANRFYVQEGVYDEFISLFAEQIKSLKPGDGFADDTTQGPLINADAVAKVSHHIADAVGKGAVVVCGGEAMEGNFFQPTLLKNMRDNMAASCEETFGPVAPVFSFKSEEEVIKRANNTPYGLAAYFCTTNLGRMMRVSDALEAGIVGVNEGIISSEVAPFGGVKESGIGREGASMGMDEYTEVKYTLTGY
ncbi:MAG: NAD-dependent succinate-semialdehyde dehydrogenase [Gammaproteobacteria bacterium]